jgi:uncharacterized protein YukE
MTNYIIKKNAQRLINYIDMINEAKNRNLRHEKEIIKYRDAWLGNISEHYQKRIDINLQIIAYLQNRVNNILNNLNK